MQSVDDRIGLGYIVYGGDGMVNIFEYTDFREYLKAYFKDRKIADPKFSHRWLAGRLDLATSNFIMLVMQGKRTLSPLLRSKISEVFKHPRKEAEYFENMVNFIQAKSGKEKDLYFSRMTAFRKNVKVDKIKEWQYEYYSNWYNPVVRELITNTGCDGSPESICKLLQPSITPSQAKRSIDLLLKLGMIKKTRSRYEQTASLITTDPEVNSLAVVNFHHAMGNLAVEALERIPKTERNITSCTIQVTAEVFDVMRKKIEDFREELLTLTDSVNEGERVYQLNFQLFPVSKKLNTRR
jgi:uncharacterized protein (TIGR02147 family)